MRYIWTTFINKSAMSGARGNTFNWKKRDSEIQPHGRCGFCHVASGCLSWCSAASSWFVGKVGDPSVENPQHCRYSTKYTPARCRWVKSKTCHLKISVALISQVFQMAYLSWTPKKCFKKNDNHQCLSIYDVLVFFLVAFVGRNLPHFSWIDEPGRWGAFACPGYWRWRFQTPSRTWNLSSTC